MLADDLHVATDEIFDLGGFAVLVLDLRRRRDLEGLRRSLDRNGLGIRVEGLQFARVSDFFAATSVCSCRKADYRQYRKDGFHLDDGGIGLI